MFKERQIDKEIKAIQRSTDKLLGEDLISMDQAIEIRQAALERKRQGVEVKLGRDEVQALQRLTQSGKLSQDTRQTVQKALSKEGYKEGNKPVRSRSSGVAPLYTRRSFLIPSGVTLGAGALTTFCIRDVINIESNVNNEVNKIMESAKANTQLANKDQNQQTLDDLHKSFADKEREEEVRSKLYVKKSDPHRIRGVFDVLGAFTGAVATVIGGLHTTFNTLDWKDESRRG